MIVGAGIAADAISTERRLGRTGWLVTHSITRGTVVMGWFVALAGISLVGLVAAAVLGWLAASPIQPTPFMATITGVASTSLAAIAVGLLLGSLLDPLPAMLAAVAVGLLVAAAAFIALPAAAVPLVALAELDRLERPVATGVQGAGIGLAITAAALVLARVALGRADL
jgi:ABC-type transport system involved in multi-copper enzyme maturation permease subunit